MYRKKEIKEILKPLNSYYCQDVHLFFVIGMLGQYHHEASSFGPARGYSICSPSQYMPSIAYAVPPGIIVMNTGNAGC